MNDRVDDARSAAKVVAGQVERSPWVERLGRAGYVAMGVSYAIVAILALQVALGDGGQTTSRQGALATVASKPFGKALLVLLAIGFTGYAAWRFVQAFLDREDEGQDAKGLGKRAGYLARGLVYVSLLVTDIGVLRGSGGGSGAAKQKEWTGRVLDAPLGRVVVGAAGLAVLGFGLWNAYRAYSGDFEKSLKTGEMKPAERRLILRLAVVGFLARAVVFSLIGVFVTKAAIDYNAGESIGLDGALAKLAQQSYGAWLLGVVAAGLLAYGAFCVAQARYRRL